MQAGFLRGARFRSSQTWKFLDDIRKGCILDGPTGSSNVYATYKQFCPFFYDVFTTNGALRVGPEQSLISEGESVPITELEAGQKVDAEEECSFVSIIRVNLGAAIITILSDQPICMFPGIYTIC